MKRDLLPTEHPRQLTVFSFPVQMVRFAPVRPLPLTVGAKTLPSFGIAPRTETRRGCCACTRTHLTHKKKKINDVEKGYYADGEDAYDMRLPFPQKELSYGAMTPLKQVVAVKRKEEAPKASTSAAVAEGGGGKKGAEGGGAAAKAESASVDEVASKMGGLSVGAAASAGKA